MTTIILAFSGTGKSYYANKYPETAIEMKPREKQPIGAFIAEVMVEIDSKAPKYLFLPCDLAIKRELQDRGVAYLVVLPDAYGSASVWVRRWLEAGDSAEDITRRVNDFKPTDEAFDGDPVIYLKGAAGEWIGNVLQKYNGAAVSKEEF